MTEETYKKARKALVEKGWLIHNVGSKDKAGEIIVDYDAIYKSSEGNTEDTPIQQTENTPENSEYTPKRDIENTYNNISSKINQNDNNSNIITNQKIKEKRQEEKRKNEEKFVF